MISYVIVTSKLLFSKFGNASTLSNCTLSSYVSIDSRISSTITVAVMSSMFSKRDSVILEPKDGSKNFSPGKVKTILRIERTIALSFFSSLRSLFRGVGGGGWQVIL